MNSDEVIIIRCICRNRHRADVETTSELVLNYLNGESRLLPKDEHQC